jgi:hypothetical protein
MLEPDPHIHGPEPTNIPTLIGSKVGWIFALSTAEAVGSITPEGETFGPMQGVNAALESAKFGLLAPASHDDAAQDDQNRPGNTIVVPTYSFVNNPTPLTSTSTCDGLSTFTPVIGASPDPKEAPVALSAM